MTPQQNTMWQTRVRQLLHAGYGSEDIAIFTETHPETVRREIALLRAEGELARMFGAKPEAE